MVLYDGNREVMQRRYEELCRLTDDVNVEIAPERDRLVTERVLLFYQLKGECLDITIDDLLDVKFEMRSLSSSLLEDRK